MIKVIGVVLLLYAVYVIYKGGMYLPGDNKAGLFDDYYVPYTYLKRSEKPAQFWFLVVVILVVAVIFLSNITYVSFGTN